MSARASLVALLAVAVSWAALGVLRDRQQERFRIAERWVWADGLFGVVDEQQAAHRREVLRVAGDDPEVRATYAAVDSLNAVPNPAMDRQRAWQDSAAASVGAAADPATGRLVAPDRAGLLADVPAGWFHGAFGAVAVLLALAGLAAPRP